jgi:glycosyltransferase involved in cell wall biosynthesis
MPRILYLTSYWPHARTSGSQLRALHLARALKSIGEVHVAGVGAEENDQATVERTAAEFKVVYNTDVVPTPKRSWLGKIDFARNPRVPYPHGLAAPPNAQSWLEQTLPTYDLVWIFKLRTANMFRQWHWPNSVVDVDDVPSTYEENIRSGERGLAKWQAGLQAAIWRRREKLLWERFNEICVCSQTDKDYLKLGDRVHVIPNGFEPPRTEPARHPVQPPRLGFIGLFDHTPNREGVLWFIRECWGRIKQQVPDCRLRLIGKGSDLLGDFPGLDIEPLGWVADAAQEISTWSGMIVPIKLGAGTRVKIADAFSRKCPVVSTSLGALGYAVENGIDLFLGDSPGDFADACVTLIRQPAKGTEMAERAWQKFLNRWTWKSMIPEIHAAAEGALRRGVS